MQRIKGLRLVGRPDMCVVAFTSSEPGVNIYSVNDAMQRRGWHLSTLQLPPALHICFTLQHTDVVPELLKVWPCHSSLSLCVVCVSVAEREGVAVQGVASVHAAAAPRPPHVFHPATHGCRA